MLDNETIRSLVENMERAAEASLQQDASFHEAMQALKWEIDSDPKVQSIVSRLQAAGGRVFHSFVPRIRIRIKTGDGNLALTMPETPAVGQTGGLIDELRDAASAVIVKSRCRHELDTIVNEAIAASHSFEAKAAQIESAGHEVVVCLDLSAYAQMHESKTIGRCEITAGLTTCATPDKVLFSDYDMKLLKSLGVKTQEN